MNKLNGNVVRVECDQNVAIYECMLPTKHLIAAIGTCVETKPTFKPGDAIGVYFDEMDVILAKFFSEDTTIKKRFTAIVDSVETGKALTRVVLDYHGIPITAVVRTTSWNSLGLDIGNEVLWLIKATKITVGPP